jgi:hypothetical protein
LSGVTTIPLAKAMLSATCRAAPSGVITAIVPGRNSSWPKRKPTLLVYAAVYGDLIPCGAQVAEVCVGDQASVGLLAKQAIPTRDEEIAVGQPIEAIANRLRSSCHDLRLAGGIHPDDLLGAPVCEPEMALVPPGRLADHQPADECAKFHALLDRLAAQN